MMIAVLEQKLSIGSAHLMEHGCSRGRCRVGYVDDMRPNKSIWKRAWGAFVT
jgi:hypothetical protein